jgi:hypothetical protein
VSARRRESVPCARCGFNDTTARCVACARPVCESCAMPSVSGGGAARVQWNGRRRGWLCSGDHDQPTDRPTQLATLSDGTKMVRGPQTGNVWRTVGGGK